jgi:uncharacterized membrane protein YdjX (TVP38/TMEM64 family)
VVASFVVGQLLLIPISGMMAAAVVVLGPRLGFVYALAGSYMAALVDYGIGRLLPPSALRGRLPRLLLRASPRLAQRGMRAVATAALVPIAPFVVVNLAAGAARVRFGRFALRAGLTLTAASLAVTLVTDAFMRAVRGPDAATVAALLLALAGALVAIPVLQRRRWRRGRPRAQNG